MLDRAAAEADATGQHYADAEGFRVRACARLSQGAPLAEVEALLQAKTEEEPETSVLDEYETLHRVWRVDDPALIQAVQQKMAGKKLLIADGHHRYETALAYRDERRAASGGSDPNAPYEFVMVTLVPMESPGLVILPTHRIVHGLPTYDRERMLEDASRFFDISRIDLRTGLAPETGQLRNSYQITFE